MTDAVSLAASGLIGVALGSLPTADLIARLWGVDLRTGGSGNPGTNNALRLGGRRLAALVLLTELLKGVAAVVVARQIGGDPGGAVAAIAATASNVYNPWFRFRGGKGLAITAGTLLAAWPQALLVLVVVIAAATGLLRRSGPASLAALTVYVVLAMVGLGWDLPTAWGLSDASGLVAMAVGQSAVMAPKHWVDTVRRDVPPLSPASP